MTTPEQTPWYLGRLTVLLAAVVVPPVGVVLLWMRPSRANVHILRRVAGFTGKAALSFLLVILTVAYLVKLGILHMEMSGAGWKPIFTWRDPKADQNALEKHRAQQAAAPPEALPTEVAAQPEPEHSAGSEVKTPAPGAEEKTTTTPVVSAYWTDFRGPNRDGVYSETPVRTSWPEEGLKPLWRQPVGGGYASFAIGGGRAYTIEQRRGNEVVAAYDIRSGRELWTNAWPTLFSEAMGGDGPRATPTWHNGRVYALGAAGELRCLDGDTGKVIWSRNILSDNGASNLQWGMAASPLVVDDKVIVLPGGRNGKSVVAYHKNTGERVWSAQDDRQAYTSPMVVRLAGQRQLLVVSGERAMGLTVEDGMLLWEFPWVTMYGINSAQPIVVDERHVFLSAGYDHGSVLLEVTRQDGKFNVGPLWESKSLKNRFNSSVLHEGHIYGFDEGIFACIDARTGERKWKGGRYGYGQVLLLPGSGEAGAARLVVTTESGELVLIKPSPDGLQEVARFQAIEGKTWNHPAIGEGILLVRNAREMAAFDLNLPQSRRTGTPASNE